MPDTPLDLNVSISLASLLCEAKTLAAANFSTYAGRPVFQEALVELCTAAAGLPPERKQEIAALLGINLR
jgi:hypothetical protein